MIEISLKEIFYIMVDFDNNVKVNFLDYRFYFIRFVLIRFHHKIYVVVHF